MSSYADRRSRGLSRSAEQAKQYSVRMRILRSAAICLAIVLLLTYVVSVLYSRYGSFTVSVNKFDSEKYSLLLSPTGQFEQDGVLRLHGDNAVDITNISASDLPVDLNEINGSHNGENNLAYTYYLENFGKDTVTYEYYLYIANVTNNVDKAIRIRLYRDGRDITYARTREDGGGAEPGTTEFLTASSICRVRVDDFAPGDVTKFTIVIWLEGGDPDCTDYLIGGMLKCDMKISVVESTG